MGLFKFQMFVIAFVSVFHRLTCYRITGSVISPPQIFHLYYLTSYKYRFTSLAWNADGTMLATGSANKTVQVWSVGSTGTFDDPVTIWGHFKDNPQCTCDHSRNRDKMEFKADFDGCLVKGHSSS